MLRKKNLKKGIILLLSVVLIGIITFQFIDQSKYFLGLNKISKITITYKPDREKEEIKQIEISDPKEMKPLITPIRFHKYQENREKLACVIELNYVIKYSNGASITLNDLSEKSGDCIASYRFANGNFEITSISTKYIKALKEIIQTKTENESLELD